MVYRNTRTGVEVVTTSEVKGNWERVDAPRVPVKTAEVKTETTEKKRSRRK